MQECRADTDWGAEPQQWLPHFWDDAAALLLRHLSELGIGAADATVIAGDFMARCVNIAPVLPANSESDVYRAFGELMFYAIVAELRLFSSREGPTPVEPLGHAELNHPFLKALRLVIAQIESEACGANGALN